MALKLKGYLRQEYRVYQDILLETESNFQLYLAITQGTYKSYFHHPLTQMIIKRNQVNC